MIAKAIRRAVNALIRSSGYALQPVEVSPVDLRQADVEPSGMLYATTIRPLLIELPIEKARSSDYYPIAQHVFRVAAACALSGEEISRRRLEEAIACYRNSVRYRNGAHRMGIEDSDAPLLAQCPAWFRLRPWDARSVAARRTDLEASARRAGQRDGVAFASADDGFLVTGSDTMVQLQAKRLHALLDSVRRRGYVRSNAPDGDIKAELLLGEPGDWAWQIRQGNHRAAVALAFGITTLPVRIVRIVYRRDAAAWPNVRTGVFSERAAHTIFDNLLMGHVSAGAAGWLEAQQRLVATQREHASPAEGAVP